MATENEILGISGHLDISDIEKSINELINNLDKVGIKTDALSKNMTEAMKEIVSSTDDASTKQRRAMEVLANGYEEAKNALQNYPEQLRLARNEMEQTEIAITRLQTEQSKLSEKFQNTVVGSQQYNELNNALRENVAQIETNRQVHQQQLLTVQEMEAGYSGLVSMLGLSNTATAASVVAHGSLATTVGIEAIAHQSNAVAVQSENQVLTENNSAKTNSISKTTEAVSAYQAEIESIRQLTEEFKTGALSEEEFTRLVDPIIDKLPALREQLKELYQQLEEQQKVLNTPDQVIDGKLMPGIDLEKETDKFNALSSACAQLQSHVTTLENAMTMVNGAIKESYQNVNAATEATQKASESNQSQVRTLADVEAGLAKAESEYRNIIGLSEDASKLSVWLRELQIASNVELIPQDQLQTITEAKNRIQELRKEQQAMLQEQAGNKNGAKFDSAAWDETRNQLKSVRREYKELDKQIEALSNHKNLTSDQEKSLVELYRKANDAKDKISELERKLKDIEASKGSGIGQQLSVGFTKFSTAASDATVKLENFLTGNGKVQEGMQGLKSGLAELLGPLTGINGTMKKVLLSMAKMALTPLGAVIMAIAVAFKAVHTWMTKSAEGQRAYAAISAYIGSILQSLIDVLVKLGSYLYHCFADAQGPLHDYGVALVKTFKSAISTVVNLVAGMGNMLKGLWVGLVDQDWSMFEKGFGQVKKGLLGVAETWSNAMDASIKGVKGIVKVAQDGLKNFDGDKLVNWFENVGKTAEAAKNMALQQLDAEKQLSEAKNKSYQLDTKIREAQEKAAAAQTKVEKEQYLAEAEKLAREKFKDQIVAQKTLYEIQKRKNELHTFSLKDLAKERELLGAVYQVEARQASQVRAIVRMRAANQRGINREAESAGRKAAAENKRAEKQAQKTETAEFKLTETELQAAYERAKAIQQLEEKVEDVRIAAIKNGAEKAAQERNRANQKELLSIAKQKEDAIKAETERQKKELEARNKVIVAHGGRALQWGDDQIDKKEIERIEALYEKIRLYTIEKQILDENKERLQSMREYMQEYGTFAEQRLAIEEEYKEKIAEARASNNPWSVMHLEASKMQELNKARTNQLVNEADMGLVFSQFGVLLNAPLEETVNKLRSLTQTDEFKTRSFDEQKKVFEAIEKAERQSASLLSINFKQVGEATAAYNNALFERSLIEKELASASEDVIQAEKKLIEAKNTGNQSNVELAQSELDVATQKYNEIKANYDLANSRVAQTQVKAAGSLSRFQAGIENLDRGLRSAYNGSLSGVWQILGPGLQQRLAKFIAGGSKISTQFGYLNNALSKSGTSIEAFVSVLQSRLNNLSKVVMPQATAEGVSNMVSSVMTQAFSDLNVSEDISALSSEVTSQMQEQVQTAMQQGDDAQAAVQKASAGIGKLIAQVANLGSNAGIWATIIGTVIQLLEEFGEHGLGRFVGTLLENVGKAISGIIGNLFTDLIPQIVNGVGDIIKGIFEGIMDMLSNGAFSKDGGFATVFGSNAHYIAEQMERLNKRNELLTKSIDALREELNGTLGARALSSYRRAVDMQTEKERNLLEKVRLQMAYSGSHHSFNYNWSGFSAQEIATFSNAIGRTWSGELTDLSPNEARTLQSYVDMWDKIGKTGKGGYGERVQEKIEEYIAQADVMEELANELTERITTTTKENLFDDFLDNLYNLANGAEDVFQQIAEGWQDMVNRMVINNLIAEQVRPEIEAWLQEVQDTMTAYSDSQNLETLRKELEEYKKQYNEFSWFLNSEEAVQKTLLGQKIADLEEVIKQASASGDPYKLKSDLKSLGSEYDSIMNKTAERVNFFREIGIIKDPSQESNQSATANSIQNISYEQADSLVGIGLNHTMLLEQSLAEYGKQTEYQRILAESTQSTSVGIATISLDVQTIIESHNSINKHLATISQNTNVLPAMQEDLNKIKRLVEEQ